MIETLKTLCGLPGVSGNEGEVRRYILGRIGKLTDCNTVDVMGNILAFKKGRKKPANKILLSAHMDEVGVIVTYITGGGYLKFSCVGGIDSGVLPGKTLYIGDKRVFGVIGLKPVHMQEEHERGKAAAADKLYIDIGAGDCLSAKKLVSVGDTGVFDSEGYGFGGGFIKAKAIDDRFGCAVLIKLIESDLPVDCSFVFTVQEEVGLRGAYTAAHRKQADIALIIEGTTAADFPSVADYKKVCRAGGGAVIPFMDNGAVYDRDLYKTLTELADKNGVPWQTKNVIAGGTDAAAYQKAGAGARTAVIAAPVRNLHSPSCVAKISDLEAVYNLTRLFLDSVAGKTVVN